jgi:hypothetical protein
MMSREMAGMDMTSLNKLILPAGQNYTVMIGKQQDQYFLINYQELPYNRDRNS